MSTARAGLRPRQQVHRGTVRASAFWLDPALLGEAEARRRILAEWTPGMSVRAVAGGYLVEMSAPRAVVCEAAPGLPLTREYGVLSSAPLSPAERRHPSLHEGAVLLVLSGRSQVFSAGAMPRVDVSTWLDVSAWGLRAPETLGAPPPPVPVLEPVPPPSRERFGPGVPEPSAEAQEMLARMEGRRAPSAAGVRRLGWWAWLREKFSRQGSSVRGCGESGRGRPGWMVWLGAAFLGTGARGARQGPSPWSRLSDWMMRNTLLGGWARQRKAEYVRRLFVMFEEGNLYEALRHAIPLGKELGEDAREALGLPGPREQLTLQTEARGAAGSVFAGGPDLYSSLQQRYREAFCYFRREGRIDEAAFVLAELLGAVEEAVSFLELRGRFKLAAELAEGRKLAPGLVVRQWFLAQDVTRAVAIARRSGAFGDAVARLERPNPPEARALRLLWAETLAEAGDYARAVQVVWPVAENRAPAREWLERGVASGGATGARLLAMWATAFADGLTVAGARVRELLDDDAPERASERFVFGLALVEEPPSASRTALVVPTLRALLRDRAAGNARFTSDLSLIKRLLGSAPDGTLRTDLPSLADCISPAWRDIRERPRIDVTVRASEAGTFTLHDVVVLPDGRLLYALGEAGARLVRADGRTVAHFDVPAFHLVPSIHGDRVLALARRDDVWRLSRLDLVTRRCSPWGDMSLTAWAPSYDGNVWFVSSENTVMMVDALATECRALWRVSDLAGGVFVIAVDATHMSFVVGKEERWTYTLADGPTLRDRSELPPEVSDPKLVLWNQSVVPDGEAAVLSMEYPMSPEDVARGRNTLRGSLAWMQPVSLRNRVRTERDHETLKGIFLSREWCLELLDLGADWQLQLTDRRGFSRAVLTFEGNVRPKVRLTDSMLLAFDEGGRGVRLDLESGEVRHLPVP
ncbi:bpX6 domain-containing protein [Myxococcus sp. NMCA1]|uniref:bpX6 domain-containing protein n=1 Tax=Myxococcus sp. NMCA1 TaxID=2996785 RepID=UPI002286AADB|nr:bpX6 domain-containing protein [Myxococcus sp. NMCA1]WAM26062.1 bpX6 domain-containing protein [Myxococcus sp. NMCA1]